MMIPSSSSSIPIMLPMGGAMPAEMPPAMPMPPKVKKSPQLKKKSPAKKRGK